MSRNLSITAAAAAPGTSAATTADNAAATTADGYLSMKRVFTGVTHDHPYTVDVGGWTAEHLSSLHICICIC